MSKRLQLLEQLSRAERADSFTWYALAQEYRKEQRPNDALAAFATLRSREPGYLPMYLMAGQLLIESGDFAGARNWLVEGIALAKQEQDSKTLSELQTALSECE